MVYSDGIGYSDGVVGASNTGRNGNYNYYDADSPYDVDEDGEIVYDVGSDAGGSSDDVGDGNGGVGGSSNGGARPVNRLSLGLNATPASGQEYGMVTAGGGLDAGGDEGIDVIMSSSSRRSSSKRRKVYLATAMVVVLVVVAVVVAVALSSSSAEKGGEEDVASAGDGTPTNGEGGGSDHDRFDDDFDVEDLSELGQLISSFSSTGGREFLDPDSYQSRALQWLEETQDVVTEGSGGDASSGRRAISTNDRYVQRYALACILFATDGVRTMFTDYKFQNAGQAGELTLPGWLNKRKWPLESDEDHDECNWNGVICDDQGYVEELLLEKNILTGTMPRETAMLKKGLVVLNLSGNLMYNVGDDGNNWLGELTNLEFLYLADTAFQYEGIPTAIGKLTKLRGFDCSYTLYFGPLKDEVFQDLQELEYLYIGGNSFNSSMPESLSTLPKLRSFYSEFSDIRGDLSFIIGMQSIYELWIDQNPLLSATIPPEIGTVSSLASLSITECDLHGVIPTEMGDLVGMKQLWLYSNRLEGEIPVSLSGMTEIEILELHGNDLVGTVDTLCTTIAYPFGNLKTFGVDCLDDISCPDTCCTCCNDECLDVASRRQLSSDPLASRM